MRTIPFTANNHLMLTRKKNYPHQENSHKIWDFKKDTLKIICSLQVLSSNDSPF